jgi:hypothetical protein
MADSIFDLQDNLSAPSQTGFDTFQQKLAADRAQLEQTRPDVAAQMPTLGAATPGQQIYQSQQQQGPEQLANTVQQMMQQFATASTPQGAKPKDQQGVMDAAKQVLLGPTNPLEPLPTYGPQGFGEALGMPKGAGGILGTGVQPIDVLAFALGAGLTSRLPQDQAMAWTMKIAGLPRAFRDNQARAANEFIRNAVGITNAETEQGNGQLNQIKNMLAIKSMADKDSFLSDLSRRLATGVPLTALEKQMYAVRGSKVLDQETLKQVLLRSNSPAEALAMAQEIQNAAKQNNLGSVKLQQPIEGGGTLTFGGAGSSGRAIVTGELSDALQTGVLSPKMVDAGFTNMDQVRAAYNERKDLERQRIDLATRGQDRADVALSQLRPEESKKLEAFTELHRTASDMLTKYEAALASHGGKQSPGLLVALKAATNSPDGYVGSVINALGQRYPDLTAQDRDFISRYASMQKFARGMLNDVGNLSNYERGLVTNMIGTPLDVPAQFRSRTGTAISDVAAAYNQARRALPARDVSMFPESLGGAKQEGGSSSGTTGQPPKGATVWRFENGKLVK